MKPKKIDRFINNLFFTFEILKDGFWINTKWWCKFVEYPWVKQQN